ncbi:Phosphatidylinositol glycan anchor biosynthesis class U protein [Fragariocoptes setiger]|uniref:Phosphatidylinositol glycan anchor biosynthesis class U protein n=1 Tax=Fragariocoptes setiger TaxID=1670756 RepID=A0ABQ7S8Y7_9ACAR|nr:Phosphatidylinositol glycan anchor biosynthesis class U protein [Fragariocoptes setiger]
MMSNATVIALHRLLGAYANNAKCNRRHIKQPSVQSQLTSISTTQQSPPPPVPPPPALHHSNQNLDSKTDSRSAGFAQQQTSVETSTPKSRSHLLAGCELAPPKPPPPRLLPSKDTRHNSNKNKSNNISRNKNAHTTPQDATPSRRSPAVRRMNAKGLHKPLIVGCSEMADQGPPNKALIKGANITLEPIFDASIISGRLPLVDAIIATIRSKEYIPIALKSISKLPNHGVKHLKKIRIDECNDTTRCQILIGLSQDDNTLHEIRNQFSSYEFFENFHVQQVPATPPRTSLQMDINCKIWPCRYAKSNYLIACIEGTIFNQSKLSTIDAIATATLKSVAEISAKTGEKCSGVTVFSQQKLINSIIVRCSDLQTNPLKHAVMVSMDAVARSSAGGCWPIDRHSSRIQCEEFNVKSEQNCPTNPSDHVPYLCTNYDIFVTEEPCIMCAMALIHSRIRRLFFLDGNKYRLCYSDKAISELKMHNLKGLNHRFEAWRAGRFVNHSGLIELVCGIVIIWSPSEQVGFKEFVPIGHQTIRFFDTSRQHSHGVSDDYRSTSIAFPLSLGFVIRLFLALSPYQRAISRRVEVSTPTNDWKNVHEGIHLLRNNISPYDGDTFHEYPISLYCYHHLDNIFGDSIYILFIIVDCFTALILSQAAFKQLNILIGYESEIVASKVTKSAQNVNSVQFKENEKISQMTYQPLTRRTTESSSLLVLWVYCLSPATILSLKIGDLTPNIGMCWYFFIEMFNHFQSFFLWVFQINAFVHAMPLAIYLRKNPFLAFYAVLVFSSFVQPYPSLANIGLITSILPQWQYLLTYTKRGIISSCAIATCAALAPIFWHLWIVMGTANANFYFGITLAGVEAQLIILIEILTAHVARNSQLTFQKKILSS